MSKKNMSLRNELMTILNTADTELLEAMLTMATANNSDAVDDTDGATDEAVEFEKGNTVEVKVGRRKVQGTIVKVKDDEYTVKFEDGTKDVYDADSMTLVEEEEEEEAEEEEEVAPKRGRKPAAEKEEKPAKKATKAKADEDEGEEDYADMSIADLTELCEKMHVDAVAYCKAKKATDKAAKQKLLGALMTKAYSGKFKLAAVQKMADKAEETISFGRGRKSEEQKTAVAVAQMIVAGVIK